MKDHLQETIGGQRMLECMIVYAASKSYLFQTINMKAKVDIQHFGTI
jgi:hypothetical protein